MSRGIDYGLGTTNINLETGIRYGVLSMHDVTQAWAEASEGDYGPASCGVCGNPAVEIDQVPFDLDDCKTLRQDDSYRKNDVLDIPEEHRAVCNDNEEWTDAGRDYACLQCARSFDSDDAYSDEAIGGFNLDDGEYVAHQGHDDTDIFVIKSPYYSCGRYCSPCAPGAVSLGSVAASVELKVGEKYGKDQYAGAAAYCFAPDWFEAWEGHDTGEYDGERTSCPYAVFRVEDDVCVFVPNQEVDDDE